MSFNESQQVEIKEHLEASQPKWKRFSPIRKMLRMRRMKIPTSEMIEDGCRALEQTIDEQPKQYESALMHVY